MKKREPEINWKERAVKAEQLRDTWREQLRQADAKLDSDLRASNFMRGIVAILLLTVMLALVGLLWWYAPRLLEHPIEIPYRSGAPCISDTSVLDGFLKICHNDLKEDEALIAHLKRRVRHLEQGQ